MALISGHIWRWKGLVLFSKSIYAVLWAIVWCAEQFSKWKEHFLDTNIQRSFPQEAPNLLVQMQKNSTSLSLFLEIFVKVVPACNDTHRSGPTQLVSFCFFNQNRGYCMKNMPFPSSFPSTEKPWIVRLFLEKCLTSSWSVFVPVFLMSQWGICTFPLRFSGNLSFNDFCLILTLRRSTRETDMWNKIDMTCLLFSDFKLERSESARSTLSKTKCLQTLQTGICWDIWDVFELHGYSLESSYLFWCGGLNLRSSWAQSVLPPAWEKRTHHFLVCQMKLQPCVRSRRCRDTLRFFQRKRRTFVTGWTESAASESCNTPAIGGGGAFSHAWLWELVQTATPHSSLMAPALRLEQELEWHFYNNITVDYCWLSLMDRRWNNDGCCSKL